MTWMLMRRSAGLCFHKFTRIRMQQANHIRRLVKRNVEPSSPIFGQGMAGNGLWIDSNPHWAEP